MCSSVDELLLDICKIADEKHGNEIIAMEISRHLPIANYFVLVTCENPIHIQAMADELEERIEARWGVRVMREGEPESRWVILDFGDVIVHLFDSELRHYYDIEGLWADVPMMKWDGKLVEWDRMASLREAALEGKTKEGKGMRQTNKRRQRMKGGKINGWG